MEALHDPIVIGTIGSPHGVRGTVRVQSSGSGQHLREGVEPVVVGVRRRILHVRQTPKGFLVDFEGVGSREEAGALRSEELLLDRSELDVPEPGERYVSDLPGLQAVDESGELVGEVAETFETAAHEVIVIRTEEGEIYVPFTLEHVPDVDLEAGRLVVRPPEAGE